VKSIVPAQDWNRGVTITRRKTEKNCGDTGGTTGGRRPKKPPCPAEPIERKTKKSVRVTVFEGKKGKPFRVYKGGKTPEESPEANGSEGSGKK